MLTDKIKQGKDLMLFTTMDQYTSTVTLSPDAAPYVDQKAYVAIAHATNHTISFSSEFQTITSKDTGLDEFSAVSGRSWTISADVLTTKDFEKLYEKYQDGTNIFLAFGSAQLSHVETSTVSQGPANPGDLVPADADNDIWEIDPNKTYFYGKAKIESLELQAENGNFSTCSISLKGQGKLKIAKGTSF